MAGLRVATLGGGLLEGLVWKKVSRVRMAVVPEVPTSWKALAGAGFLISWILVLYVRIGSKGGVHSFLWMRLSSCSSSKNQLELLTFWLL